MKNDQKSYIPSSSKKASHFFWSCWEQSGIFFKSPKEGHILVVVAFSTMPKYVWLFFHPCSRSICQAASFFLSLSLFYVVVVLAACEDSKKAKGSSRVRHKNPFLIKACHFNQVPANLNNSCTQSQPLTYEDRHFFWELNWVEKEPPSWLFLRKKGPWRRF